MTSDLDAGTDVGARPGHVHTRRLLVVVLIAIALLVTLSLVTQLPQTERVNVRFKTLDLNSEISIATWLSGAMLVVCAALLAVVASRSSRDRAAWWGLAAGAAYASMDEMIEIHERFDGIGERLPDALVLESSAWMTVGIGIVVVMAVVFLPFFLRLPVRYRVWFGGAAATFLCGAVLVEYWNSTNDIDPGRTVAYVVGTGVEEALEMLGILLLATGLIRYSSDPDVWPDRRLGRLLEIILPPQMSASSSASTSHSTTLRS